MERIPFLNMLRQVLQDEHPITDGPHRRWACPEGVKNNRSKLKSIQGALMGPKVQTLKLRGLDNDHKSACIISGVATSQNSISSPN